MQSLPVHQGSLDRCTNFEQLLLADMLLRLAYTDPEPARLLALQGASLILIPTALALGPVQRLTPECVIPTRALENHVHIAYCNFQGTYCTPLRDGLDPEEFA